MDENRWLLPGNIIALIALVISLFGLGWQAWDWWIGPEPELIDVEARTVEFRCSSSSKSRCWGDRQSDQKPTGRIAVVLPVFLTNTGASGYDTVVSKVFADLRFHDQGPQATLVANQFWGLVQGSDNQSRPFSPFVVEAGGANGFELRFVAFAEENFIIWDEVSEEIAGSGISSAEIVIRAELLGGEELTTTCIVNFTDRLRQVISERRERRGVARLTTTCSQIAE